MSDTWLCPIGLPAEQGTGELFERGDCVVQSDRRLGQVIHRRPAGITGNQWNAASRTRLAFVVWDRATRLPVFAADFREPGSGTGDTADARGDRMTDAVCAAVGLSLLRVESSAVGRGPQARRLIEYLLDGLAFATGTAESEESLDQPTQSYRDITGRLPDGRTGYVNDLGAVARAAAVEAYVRRQVADPIIRGLHVRWTDGPAEGWAWLEMGDGMCLFERTRIWQHRFSCGVDPGRLAEDLSAAALGERLTTLDTAAPPLHEKGTLGRELDRLRLRRDELVDGFGFDHVSFAAGA
jgi:hypothetical protein